MAGLTSLQNALPLLNLALSLSVAKHRVCNRLSICLATPFGVSHMLPAGRYGLVKGGTRARLPAPLPETHSVKCYLCALRPRPAVAHHPNESPHTTETEPEVCFIDTEACQARNLNSTHTRIRSNLYLAATELEANQCFG